MEKTALAKPRMFAPQMISAVIFLVIQYALGMYINLFVEIPRTGPAAAWSFAWHSIPVAAHIIIGTLSLLFTIVLLVRAIRMKDRHWITLAAIATAALLLAVTGGEEFITTHNDIFSYLMSLGFVAAILDFSWGYFKG